MAELAAYRAKRDFSATAEPEGGSGDDGGDFAFVIQKHDASRLHYDLRLELDGVMKSWAVTKGPSLVPGDKRLAVHVEDHPIEYNAFEGTIPKGQYGGGTVLIWDRGRWVPGYDPHYGFAKGHLEFRLEGEKLSGVWHLVRMRQRPREKQEAWLLIKSEDEAARGAGDPDILEEQPLSVATGRSLAEIAADPDGDVWQSNRGTAAEQRTSKRASRRTARPRVSDTAVIPSGAKQPRASAGASWVASSATPPRIDGGEVAADASPAPGLKAPMPKSVAPCLATLVARVPSGPLWLHEIKWDGYRLVAFKSPGGHVRLATRRGHDWTPRFPAIAAALEALPVDSVVLDGEAVIEGENGVASFAALQAALSNEGSGLARAAILYAFDLLYLDGHDLRSLPLDDRKRRLAGMLPAGGAGGIRLGEHLEADGGAMMRGAAGLGLEGVISKRRDRPYRSGRGDDWVKVKFVDRQDLAVVGFTPSANSSRAIGSLVLGYHEDGKLRLAGRAGTGYSGEMARALWKLLEPTRVKLPPIVDRPTADERRGVVWVAPERVAEIEFRGWTGEDRLRQAAFKGLREDKTAAEIVRERPKAVDGPDEGGGAEATSPPSANEVPSEGARKPGKPKRPRDGTAVVAGVTLTHPERVLWDDGITKQDLAEFYVGIAEWLLPQVADRPLSLLRCPGGVEAGCFFQKHAWAGIGDSIGRHVVRDEKGEDEEVLFVRDVAGVISMVQASVLEIHPWGCRMADVERADRITIDLDPGDGVAVADLIAAAREVRERLAASGLESFVKTTGGKGLHVVVPLTGPAPWPAVKAFAKTVADGMAADSPARFIAKATKAARLGLIYVDYLRNGRGATAVAAYSTRARAGAPISVPLRWDELKPSLQLNGFTLANLPDLLRRLRRDPWAELEQVEQGLPDVRKRGRGG